MPNLSILAPASRPSVRGDKADEFVLERDLLGLFTGRGSFKAVSGLERGFSASLKGSWDGMVFRLEEEFLFDDGEKDHKTWVLTKQPDGSFEGARDDVIGIGTGMYRDGILEMDYVIEFKEPSQQKGMRLNFRDVMYKTASGQIINRANASMFGVRVATVDLTIIPSSATDSIAAE